MMKAIRLTVFQAAVVAAAVGSGCGYDKTCSVTTNQDGNHLLECPDGTSFPLEVDAKDDVGLKITIDGDLHINSAEDVISAQWVTEVTGNLFVNAEFDESMLILPSLVEVGGAMQVEETGVRYIALPRLERIAELVIRLNPELEALQINPLCLLDGPAGYGELRLGSNPRLPECYTKALAHSSRACGASGQIETSFGNNREDCVCSEIGDGWPVTYQCGAEQVAP